MYGLILYYATSMFDHYYKEITYSRPEFLYFWVYYFSVNFIWMIFPGSKSTILLWEVKLKFLVLLVKSVRTIAQAFNTLEKLDPTLKNGSANGSAKKNK